MPEAPVILVVEDEYLLLEPIEEALVTGGFQPVFLGSCEEAAALLRSPEAKFSALVTDINLREKMNGWQLATPAREIRPELPVVYMTAASGDEWPAHGVPNSILLQKPFAPAQLVTAVSQLLNTGSPRAS